MFICIFCNFFIELNWEHAVCCLILLRNLEITKKRMIFLLFLSLKTTKSQECADYEFAMKCMDQCYLDQQSCMSDCGEEEICRFSCYNFVAECINQCPCQNRCPRGCAGCSHSICQLRGRKLLQCSKSRQMKLNL